MGKTLNRKEFIDGFVSAVNSLKNGEDGTYFWWLKQNDDNGNDWAIVVGWSEGWDDLDDSCCKGHYRIMAKVAYQSHKNIMQCDYDVDWTIPHDEETGEVDDCDIAIYETDTEEDLRRYAEDLLKWSKDYI